MSQPDLTVSLASVSPTITLGTIQTNVTIPGPIVVNNSSGQSNGWVHPFTFGDATPVPITLLLNISAIKILILTPWNGTFPTLEIGDTGDTDRLVRASQVNLKKVSTWIVHPQYRYPALTPVSLRLVADGSTQGNGLIFLEW
jgi:hypothetical protein